MDSATVSRYNKAYNDGRDLPEKKNPLCNSWKYYKDRSQAELSATQLNTTISLATESKSDEGADDLFALPKFKTTPKRSTKIQNQSFFVLTSDECYEIKRKAMQEKEKYNYYRLKSRRKNLKRCHK
jgi:hypothetical protein